jgi:ADP-ribosylglycohydrolase
MELLETQDPEKKKLIEASDRHKHELEKEVKAMADKTERTLKNALIIGGALALTYLVVSQLSGSKGKKRKKAKAIHNGKEEAPATEQEEPIETNSPPSFLSQLGERVATQATVMLLDIAKEKLADYLSKRKQHETEHDRISHTGE